MSRSPSPVTYTWTKQSEEDRVSFLHIASTFKPRPRVCFAEFPRCSEISDLLWTWSACKLIRGAHVLDHPLTQLQPMHEQRSSTTRTHGAAANSRFTCISFNRRPHLYVHISFIPRWPPLLHIILSPHLSICPPSGLVHKDKETRYSSVHGGVIGSVPFGRGSNPPPRTKLLFLLP